MPAAVHRLTFGRLRGFGRVDAGFLLLSIVSSVAYVATRWTGPLAAAVAFKALSIAPLAVLAFRVLGAVAEGAGPRRHARVILAMGLALSSAGDVFLAVD